MKRSLVASATALLGLSVGATCACATIIELGATKSPLLAPSCPPKLPPAQCTIILTRATSLETIRDGIAYPTKANADGQIVAFTVGLSGLSANAATRRTYIHNLDATYGGTTRVAITVLRRVGKKRQRRWTVVGESPIVHVQPFLGQVVQFPLATSIPIRRGDTIGLTTPTWAPVLSIMLPTKKFAYRQSRKTGCNNPPGISQAQLTIGQTAPYGCDYPGTRVEYTATEITNPVPPANFVHRPRQR